MIALSAAALVGGAPTAAIASLDCSNTKTGLVPITDLGSGTYLGFQGGLYPGGSNVRPASHTALGVYMAQQVKPRDASGALSASGKIAFLSVGMSNTRREFEVFLKSEKQDSLRNGQVVLVNAAQPGMTAELFADPLSPYWPQSISAVQSAGATALQVQVAWIKETNQWPELPIVEQTTALRDQLRSIVYNLRANFPNLMLVYMSSRVYAGYSTSGLSPEPHAYAGGFAVKWLVEEQIAGLLPAGPAPKLPWIDWGPYLWADGVTPRSDGLTWLCSDFYQDGVHPSGTGAAKVADMLDGFLHSDVTSALWYAKAPLADFALSVATTIQTVAPGQSTSYTVSITPVTGWSGPVTFAVFGLPAGAMGSFTSNPATSTTKLSVTSVGTTPVGSYPLMITGSSGSLIHALSVTLVVGPAAGDFTISASPASRTIAAGGTTTYTVNITPAGGFAGAVSLSAAGLPGSTLTFSPNPTTSASTLTVQTSAVARGIFTITIVGKSATLVHSTAVTMKVTK